MTATNFLARQWILVKSARPQWKLALTPSHDKHIQFNEI